MSCENSIPYTSTIYNFFIYLKLTLYLTKPQLNHVSTFVFSSAQRGYNGKVTQIVEESFTPTHRTSFGEFLSNSPWNEDYILRAIQEYSIKKIWDISRKTKKPVFVIIDDTICKKTKPSSKANNPIEKCQFFKSNLDKKTVYGHQVVGVLLKCDDVTIPYYLQMYDKDNMSKVKMAQDVIDSLPKPPYQGYVLADSWYSSKKIIKTSRKRGFHYLGALKTNRVIYPDNLSIGHQIKGFAKTLTKDDFRLVTVGKNSYYVYKYQGRLNDIKEAIVILSYPKDALFQEKSLKAFISTDVTLDITTILEYYTSRWKIEVFFRQNKMDLGLDNYQIRSQKAIKRFLILSQLSYLYCIFQSLKQSNKTSFSEGLQITRKESKQEIVRWIHNQTLNGNSVDVIFEALKIV